MKDMPSVSLPRFDRNLLRAMKNVVPVAEREAWSRAWEAELWHTHHHTHNSRIATTDLFVGVIRDALWLRTDSWRRTFSGTAVLCLASLLGLCVFALAITLAINGSWHSLGASLNDQFSRFLVQAPLVVFVTFATSSRRHLRQSSTIGRID